MTLGTSALLGPSCTNESAEGEIRRTLHSSPFSILMSKDEWRVTTGETISRSLKNLLLINGGGGVEGKWMTIWFILEGA